MLDKYVYKNLERFGNTVIGEEDYKKYGEEKILSNLKRHGLNCKFKIVEYHIKEAWNQIDVKTVLDKTYIVEVV